MNSRFVLCSFAALALFGSPLFGATYRVAQRSPSANDEGPGTTLAPWKTISRAARSVRPGDRVLVDDGIYREQVVITQSGTEQNPISFEAAPGAHVVLTGADQLKDWKEDPAHSHAYSTAWPHRFVTWSSHMTHPDDDYHRVIGRCEQVAIDGYLLRQVLAPAQLAPGTFYADVTNQLLFVWDAGSRPLDRVFVEGAVRQEILRVEGQWVCVRGLRFKFAANMAQHGAVVLAGAHDVLEDCILENMNASGAAFLGTNQVVRRCVFRDNGQLGFGASGAHGLLFTECLVENNNVKGFDRGWEAGGDKLVLCRDVLIEHSQFLRNHGNGIWFDIGNEHCTVRQNLIADNDDSGIFYEISFGLQAHDNVIVGNGFSATSGAWGAQAGISLSSSPDCVIERNLLLGNREGFNFREQTRTTPRIGNPAEVPVWNHDQLIRNNFIGFNRDAQIWGWFDVKGDRIWPAGDKPHAQPSSQPTCLEDLRLKFAENTYYAAPDQGWFVWGVTWAKHQRYSDLASFQSALGVDVGSQVLKPEFHDMLSRDYRLPPEQWTKLEASYPKGSVPGVTLGRAASLTRP